MNNLFWIELGYENASHFLDQLKTYDPDAYQQFLLAVQDNTQEELDTIRQLQVAHFGDN